MFSKVFPVLRGPSLIAAAGAFGLAGMLAGQSAQASLLAYEPFNYTVGTSLNGQATNAMGFTGNWSGGSGTISPGSLSEGNLATSDNSLSVSPSGGTLENLTNPVAATVDHPLWISFLIRTPATASDVDGGWGGIALVRSSSTDVFTYPFIGYANNGAFVIQTQGGENDVNGSSVSANTTYLMVVEDIANSSGPDTLNLWVNPTTGVSSPTGAPDITNSVIGPIGSISGIGTNNGGYSNSYDEIRIGTSYADVTPAAAVPEPAALGLAGVGALGLLLKRRRKMA